MQAGSESIVNTSPHSVVGDARCWKTSLFGYHIMNDLKIWGVTVR